MGTNSQTCATGIQVNQQNAQESTGPRAEKGAPEVQHKPDRPRLAGGPVPPVTTERNNTPAPVPPTRVTPQNPSPKPPILPSLPRIHGAIAQNKPNFQNPKTTAISFATMSYTNIPSRPARKNKPNQTQFQTPRALPVGVATLPATSRQPGSRADSWIFAVKIV